MICAAAGANITPMTWLNWARGLAATWGAGWKRSRRRLDGRHPSRLFCRFSVREYKGILFFSPQAGAFLCGAGDNAVALCRVASSRGVRHHKRHPVHDRRSAAYEQRPCPDAAVRADDALLAVRLRHRSEEHTSELQSLM